jgi:Ca-activated chloride channel family protein
MSFGSPIGLLALLLIPLLALAMAGARARARKTAIRFPAADTLLAAAGGARDWGRYVASGLALLAVASLAFALSKPKRTVHIPVEQASIVLVTDHSGSMAATDVSPDRLGAAQRAAQAFIDKLPGSVKLGAVAFSTYPDSVQAPSTDHDASRAVIANQSADGNTDIGDAMQSAIDLLAHGVAKHPPAAVVLLSDGAASQGTPDPVGVAQRARQLNVPVYTVALGTADGVLQDPVSGSSIPVSPDPATLREIARVTRAKSFSVSDSGSLKSIYEQLGSQLGTRAKQHEISSSFAIGGLLLLVAAGIASVLTVGRLP